MHKASGLHRPNLAHHLTQHIRQMIVNGELAPGDRINEVHVADRLGISRTPLREALASLASEGAVTSVARIGFFVTPLTVNEVQQIYPMRAILDPEALRIAGLPNTATIDRLEELNRQMAQTTDQEERINLDDAWHLLLLVHCPNRVIVGLIQQFIRRTRRYEMALMRDGQNVYISTTTHERIIEALRKGDLTAACDALRRNMQGGFEPIVAWLQSRERT